MIDSILSYILDLPYPDGSMLNVGSSLPVHKKIDAYSRKKYIGEMARCVSFPRRETFDGLHMPQQLSIIIKQLDKKSTGYLTMGRSPS
jgi:hypothetical protein